ncbi:hypothetical protein J2I47_05445 [Fibrella sp. HMF5335]|uniref:Uncharacterized protein n=1 Tax=Fibrella rubiginis TaxID=2817060 RepID=A0A939GEY5_9BACT|nr:hypothetical protein [Fibrella rubiginis]MBO0935984.1 hypothetical protein [Fibrella rubiginis]
MLSYRFLAWLGPFMLLCLGGCRVAQPAYFSPAQPAYTPSLLTPPDQVTLAPAPVHLSTAPQPSESAEPHYSTAALQPRKTVHGTTAPRPITTSLALSTGVPVRHGNPDITVPRRPAWLYTSQLMAGSQTNYTANQLIPDELPSKRRVPKGVFYALGGSVLPYGLFLLAPVAPWVWVLSLTLPLASMLIAAGSLAKIRRNKAQFRGRGWAALALVLATSFVGMALVTFAALATSGILWE